MQKLLFWLFCLTAFFTYGQNTVTGKITDANTGEPLVGATVYIQQLEKGTITDLDGNFQLDGLQKGHFSFLFSSLGYGSKTLEVEIPSENELNIQLSPTAIEMEEVIVSTPFHQLQSENVMKVERLNADELKNGALNLSEGISSIAGVENITTGSGIGKPVIRGLSSNRVLVYTQGVRLENQQFGDEHGLGLSSSGMESVEVIKGPASLLYGSDALGGVLYLNPEKYAPADSSQVDAKAVYYSNTLGNEANAGFKSSGEKLKFLIRGNYAAHSDYETGDGERVTNSRFKEWDLKTGLGFRNDFYKADLRYNYNSNKLGIPEEIGEQTTAKEPVFPYQLVQNHVLSLDNKFYLSSSSLDLKLGYTFNDRKEFEETIDPALEMHLETLSYDLKYNLPKKGNLDLIMGLQGMHQTNNNFGEELLIPDALINDVGILSTAHYHLQKVDFQAGLRYDHRFIDAQAHGEPGFEGYIAAVSRSFDSYNGALGMKYDFPKQITARLNLATGFRAPNLAELTSNGTHEGANRYEIGNRQLDNEQNYQFDLSLEYRNRHIEIFANGFYNHINDYIYLEPTGRIIDENDVYQYVQNNARLYGGEAGFHLHPHPLDWLHFESSFEMVIGEQENGKALPLIPAHSVMNRLRLEMQEFSLVNDSYFSISLKSVFDQNRTGLFETSSNGYALWNAGFGGNLDLNFATLELQLSGTNLLNKTYIAHLSRLKPDGIANMGRNLIISARLNF
ncbi:MAG: TonB-dependent receptor [Salinimicrobium sp.]